MCLAEIPPVSFYWCYWLQQGLLEAPLAQGNAAGEGRNPAAFSFHIALLCKVRGEECLWRDLLPRWFVGVSDRIRVVGADRDDNNEQQDDELAVVDTAVQQIH